MSEKFSLEIDQDFFKNFFELADMPIPETSDDVEQEKLDEALDIIKNKLNTVASLSQSTVKSVESTKYETESAISTSSNNSSKKLKTVLVVDDLGIVTVQLQSMFKKLGFEVTVSNELFDAIEKYKAQDFGYTVSDLFIPTEREGFILIDEIKKLSLFCKINTKIIVMSASNKKEHKEKCLNRGADNFIEKAPGWQQKIAEICMQDD